MHQLNLNLIKEICLKQFVYFPPKKNPKLLHNIVGKSLKGVEEEEICSYGNLLYFFANILYFVYRMIRKSLYFILSTQKLQAIAITSHFKYISFGSRSFYHISMWVGRESSRINSINGVVMTPRLNRSESTQKELKYNH